MTTPDNNASYHHKVYRLSLDTGAVRTGWPVDVDTAVSGFDSGIQNQRGALQFLNGVVYVPYGGYDGDGETYYGSVIGFPVATRRPPPGGTPRRRRAASGDRAPADRRHVDLPRHRQHLGGNNTWGGGEAVIRLAPGPTFSGNTADYSHPATGRRSTTRTPIWAARARSCSTCRRPVPAPGRRRRQGREPLRPEPRQPGRHRRRAAQDAGDRRAGEGRGRRVHDRKRDVRRPAHRERHRLELPERRAEHGGGADHAECHGGCGQDRLVLDENDLASPMVTTTDGTSNAIVWNMDSKLYGWNGDTGAVIVDGTRPRCRRARRSGTRPSTPRDASSRA